MYENLYVKQFILYSDESVNYYFQEIRGKKSRTTDRQILDNRKSAVGAGKYGKLNDMACLGPAARHLAMLEYEEEERPGGAVLPDILGGRVHAKGKYSGV